MFSKLYGYKKKTLLISKDRLFLEINKELNIFSKLFDFRIFWNSNTISSFLFKNKTCNKT